MGQSIIMEVVSLAKHTNGPDWTDVAMIMSAIGALHGCQVELCVTADIQGHNGSLKIVAIAHFELLPGSSLPETVQIVEHFPNLRAARMGEAAYNAVWQLDYAIGKAYNQQTYLKAE